MSKPGTTVTRRRRLEMRVSAEQDALIRQAADIEDTTVTAFVLDSVTARAERVLKQRREVVLSNETFDAFVEALDRPAASVPALVELFDAHSKLAEE